MSRPNKLIQFYLTNRCNSRCNTCNIWQNKGLKELSLIRIQEIISEFPNADYVFGGGEFTLYSQKDRLLAWCDEYNVNYTVLTNAVNISLLDALLSLHDVKNLTISCDGVHHDKIRGISGNLKNIENIVESWKEFIPNIKLSYTLSSLNQSSIDRDMDYFRNLGFDKIYFCIAQNMDLLKAEGDITPDIESLKYFNESYSFMLYDKDRQLLDDFVNGRHRICDSVKDVHTIYTNGDVVRCQSLLSDNVIGNIYNNHLSDILNADKTNLEGFSCPHNNVCELVCQRRYDYEDRV